MDGEGENSPGTWSLECRARHLKPLDVNCEKQDVLRALQGKKSNPHPEAPHSHYARSRVK